MSISQTSSRSLCRFCAFESMETIPLFPEADGYPELIETINKLLPFKICLYDGLPQQSCKSCFTSLKACKKFADDCVKAHDKLQCFFIKSFENESQLNLTNSCSKVVKNDEWILKYSNLDKVGCEPSCILCRRNLKDRFEIDANQCYDCLNLSRNILQQSSNYFSVAEENDELSKDNISNDNISHEGFSELCNKIFPEDHVKVKIDCFNSQNEQRSLSPNSSKSIPVVDKNNSFIKKDDGSQDVKNILHKDYSSTLQSLGNKRNQGSNQQSKSLLCDICGKVFKHPANLRAHKATHLNDDLKKKHLCSTCGKRFFSKFQMTEHQNIHLGLKPYACDVCDKKFHKRILLRQHSLTHLPESELFECNKCGLRFNRKGNLLAHQKIHDQSRVFSCRVCSLSFSDMRALLLHRKTEHIPQKTADSCAAQMKYNCSVCKKYFESAETLDTHEKTHKKKENRSVKCHICEKVLTTKTSLKYHVMSKHSNHRPHLCSFCSENSKTVGFMSTTLLKNHERLHTGQSPFQCDQCDKSFRSQQSLKQHKLKHSDQRKHACDICSKHFKTKGSLMVHLKIHSGDKPYVCDRCGHSFIQKNDMLKHQRKHTNSTNSSNNGINLEAGSLTNPVLVDPPQSDQAIISSKNVDLTPVLSLSDEVQRVFALDSTSALSGDTIIFTEDQNLIHQISSAPTHLKSITVNNESGSSSNVFNDQNFIKKSDFSRNISEVVAIKSRSLPCISSSLNMDESEIPCSSVPLIFQSSNDIIISDSSHNMIVTNLFHITDDSNKQFVVS